MTYDVLMGTLNPTHSLTYHLPTVRQVEQPVQDLNPRSHGARSCCLDVWARSLARASVTRRHLLSSFTT